MAALVSFHAHPDDESLICAGTLARSAAEGHRVVLVMATRGEQGEVADGLLGPGERLGERRATEVEQAARTLGVNRTEFLGYLDSGLSTEAPAPSTFCRADLDEAAGRLAAILREERADVLTVHDPGGVTGHRDHLQVHRVGVRAAELAGTGRVYEATINRDHVRQVSAAAEAGGLPPPPGLDLERLGLPGEEITTTVDVRRYLALKRRAVAAHASQGSHRYLLSLPTEVFDELWGWEWFVRVGWRGRPETSLFEGMR